MMSSSFRSWMHETPVPQHYHKYRISTEKFKQIIPRYEERHTQILCAVQIPPITDVDSWKPQDGASAFDTETLDEMAKTIVRIVPRQQALLIILSQAGSRISCIKDEPYSF